MREAPLDVRKLVTDTERFALAPVRPIGVMWKHLGRQYSVEEIFNADVHDQDMANYLRFVRAYDVVPLRNTTLTISSGYELEQALAALLHNKLPEFEWRVSGNWSKIFLKHLIVHGSLPGPKDSLTGQPMALEIFGRLVEINSMNLMTPAGVAWRTHRLSRCARAVSRNKSLPGLAGAMTIAITNATYSNLRYPGIGIPLYS